MSNAAELSDSNVTVSKPLTKKDAKGFNEMLQAVGHHKDKEAFIELFEHFAPRIKSFLMKGGANPDQADELAQEAMLTIWNKAGSYDSKQAAASTWIFTIARNKRIDALRKTKHFESEEIENLVMTDEKENPSENVIQLQESSRLTRAIEELPQEQAKLVRKSFFEDKSHAEIAQETGIALGTVKSRIRLALERLRKETKVQELWH